MHYVISLRAGSQLAADLEMSARAGEKLVSSHSRGGGVRGQPACIFRPSGPVGSGDGLGQLLSSGPSASPVCGVCLWSAPWREQEHAFAVGRLILWQGVTQGLSADGLSTCHGALSVAMDVTLPPKVRSAANSDVVPPAHARSFGPIMRHDH